MENWQEVYASAKQRCHKCRCCPQCNGAACRGETPGPGGKGSGNAFVRNIDMLKQVFITMDTISENTEISTQTDFFGHEVSLPVYAAPISGIRLNYGADLDDLTYTQELVELREAWLLAGMECMMKCFAVQWILLPSIRDMVYRRSSHGAKVIWSGV